MYLSEVIPIYFRIILTAFGLTILSEAIGQTFTCKWNEFKVPAYHNNSIIIHHFRETSSYVYWGTCIPTHTFTKDNKCVKTFGSGIMETGDNKRNHWD
jgi:hypothetical protein